MTDPVIPTPGEIPAAAADERFAGRFEVKDGVRRHVARGTIINAGFLVGLSTLGFLKGFLVAAFLTAEDYGLWGILVISVTTLAWLSQTGIGAKYVQQEEEVQEEEFQKAFTLQLVFNVVSTAVLMMLVPVIALIYGRDEIVVPGLVLCLVFPASSFTAPTWIFYRQMKFFQQRLLQAVEPFIAFFVTIGLAVAGAGYWSLIIGLLTGAWCAALAAVLVTPYPLRLRFDRETLRRYTAFSWPVMLYGATGLVIAQTSVLILNFKESLAVVGAVALTATITNFTDRVDGIVTGALYPAMCAVQDRLDLLFESFVKSNRLALMWGMPFGVGVAVFAGELVEFGLGDKWHDAVPLLHVLGVMAAVNHVGFNWDACYRARGETKPIAVLSVLTAVIFMLIGIPWMLTSGLDGFVGSIVAITVVGQLGRAYFLRKLFGGFGMLGHFARSIAPTIPAAGAILLYRAVEGAPTSGWMALAQLAVYLAITVLVTALLEQPLLREISGYLRSRRVEEAPVAT
jgi:PST family polysaccharide transporter